MTTCLVTHGAPPSSFMAFILGPVYLCRSAQVSLGVLLDITKSQMLERTIPPEEEEGQRMAPWHCVLPGWVRLPHGSGWQWRWMLFLHCFLGCRKKKNHLSKVLPFCLVGKWTKPWGLSHVLSNPIGMIKITYASSIFHWNQFRNQNQNQKRNKEPATFWVRSQTRDWKNKIIVGGSTKGDRETQEVQGHEEQLKRKAHRSQALPHHLSGPILRSVDTWEKDRRQISFSEGCFRLQ